MAIQILVMTDDPADIQDVIDALEDRRVRVLVHPLDSSLLSAAREAGPAAILLDASSNSTAAQRFVGEFQDDSVFSSTPIFGLGGPLEDVTSYYENLSESLSIAAEILAIAELSFGLQGSDDAGLFEGLEEEMDVDAAIGPDSSAAPPKTPPPPPSLPPVPRAASAPASAPASGNGAPPSSAAADLPPNDDPEPAPARPRRSSRPSGSRSAALTSGRESLHLKQDLLAKDREILALRSQVTELEGASLEKEGELLETLENVQNLEEHVHDLKAQLDSAANEKQDAQTELDALRSTHAELVQQNEALTTQLQEAQEQLKDTSKLEEIENTLQAVNEKYEATVAQRDEVLAISSELEDALALAEQRVAAQDQTLEAADGAINALRENLGVYTEAAHSARAHMADQTEAIEALREQFEAALKALRENKEVNAEALPESSWEESYNNYAQALEQLSEDADASDAQTEEMPEIAASPEDD